MKNKVILSLLTVILSISLFIVPAYAEGTNIYSWVYGTYTSDYSGPLDNISQIGTLNIPFGEGVIPIPIAKTHAYQEISVTMSGYMSGTVSMSVTPLTSLQWADLYISGASIDSWNYTTGILNLRINGTDHFTVTFLNRSTFTSWLNQALSISLTGSLTNVGSPAYNLNEIDIKLADTNNNLSYILSAINDIDSYQDDYLSLLEDIETYTSQLPTISTTLTNGFNNVTQKLNSINENLSSLNISNYSHGFFRTMTGNDPTKVKQDIYGSYVTYNNSITLSTYLYNGSTQCFIYESDANNVYPVFSNTNITCTVQRTLRTNGGCVYYVELTNGAGNGTYSFTFNNSSTDRKIYPYYFGYRTTIPIDLAWACRGYFNDAYTAKLNDVITAINNMSLSVNNMTVNTTGIVYNVTTNQINNSVTEYNTNITTVYNVENSLQLSFETNIEDINALPNGQQLLQITNTSEYMNTIIEDVGELKFIKYPIAIYLIGIVLIAMLG